MKKLFQFEDDSGPLALREAEREIAASQQTRQAMQVHGLLDALREVEEFESRLSESQFHAVIQDAVLACGFEDEVDAWGSLMDHLRSGTCRAASCRCRMPVGDAAGES